MNNPVPVEFISSFTQANQSLMLHLATELLGEGVRSGDFQRFAELAQVQQDYIQQMGTLWLNTMDDALLKVVEANQVALTKLTEGGASFENSSVKRGLDELEKFEDRFRDAIKDGAQEADEHFRQQWSSILERSLTVEPLPGSE